MIKLRPFNGAEDCAAAVTEFLQTHGQHIIEHAPRISPEDRTMMEDARSRMGSDFAQLSNLVNLTMNSVSSALAHDLIAKVMLGAWMTGVGATCSPEAKKWGDALKGHRANQGNIEKAATKNVDLQTAIKAEAEELGISLSVSEECAKRLQPGVLVRCGQDPLAKDGTAPRGFGWKTISRQIQAIL